MRRTVNSSGVEALSASRVSDRVVVVMEKVNLQKQTALLAGERSMMHMRRSAGVGHRPVCLAADRKRAAELEDFFPIFMEKRLRREHAGSKAKQARARPAPVRLVQRAGEDL